MEQGRTVAVTSRQTVRGWLEPGETAPLELLVGSDQYASTLATSFRGFVFAMCATATAALTLPGSRVSTAVKVVAFPLIGLLVATVVIVWVRHISLSATTYFWISFGCAIPLLAVFRAIGADLPEVAAIVPAALATSCIFYSRTRAYLLGGLLLVGYAIALTAPGHPAPLNRWLLVAGTAFAFGGVSAWIASKLRALAAAERAAAAEVERLNATLAARVAAQVDEIESLSTLERFLSPQVAAAVRRSSDASLLEPHRRQIAVLFVDLRGFTGFTAGAEPEDVVDVLTDYYAAVGERVRELDATIGSFIGDGIMAYFNDPFPCDDPAGRAVEMAVRLRPSLDELADRWRRRGYQLGYGIGIAYGYATLGTVGFEGRSDYTALGTVVNLASRLCGEAASGDVLIDARAYDALAGRHAGEDVELQLKGFLGSVTAHRLAR